MLQEKQLQTESFSELHYSRIEGVKGLIRLRIKSVCDDCSVSVYISVDELKKIIDDVD
jgi:hypothetical protein